METCDGVDNDGDGEIDEGFDGDGDGVGDCLQCAVAATGAVGGGESAATCEPRAPGGDGVWHFELLWDFMLDGGNKETSIGGCAVPLVADLTRDGVGDVICQNAAGEALLYVVDGSTQEHVWESRRLKGGAPIAVADVNGDSHLELVGLTQSDNLVSLAGLSGEEDWLSAEMVGNSNIYPDCVENTDLNICDGWDPTSVADLDGDGDWEVLTAAALSLIHI